MRIGDIAPDPKTLVVVNCAGRTRSIMGAESLRRAGIPNKVVALRNGTMGWELAGFRCDRGRTEKFAPGTPKSAATALQRAQAFAEDSGVGGSSARSIWLGWRTIRTARCMCWTCAILANTARGIDPVASARRAVSWCRRPTSGSGCAMRASCWWMIPACAPGWRGRGRGRWAIATCSWWKGGWNRSAPPAARAAARAGSSAPSVPTIDVTGLVALLDSGEGTAIIDLARSVDFREGHIPGALWGVRTRLAALKAQLAGVKHVVVTSPDGVAGASRGG